MGVMYLSVAAPLVNSICHVIDARDVCEGLELDMGQELPRWLAAVHISLGLYKQ